MIRTLSLLLLLQATAFPQQSDPPRQSAEAALGRAVNAHGGQGVAMVRSLILRGTSTRTGGRPEPLKVIASLDGSVRWEYGNPVVRTLIQTPTDQREIRDGKITVRQAHSGLYASLDLLSVLGMQNDRFSGSNRGIVGDVRFNGRDNLRVHAGKDRQELHYGRVLRDERDIDFDKETGLVAAVHRQGYADDSLDLTFVTSYAFSYYTVVEGVALPLRIECYLDGKLKETIQIETIEINPVLPSSEFTR